MKSKSAQSKSAQSKSTRRKTASIRKSRRNGRVGKNVQAGSRKLIDKNKIVKVFMNMLTMIKVYHWNTHSYAQHKATDELHERLSSNVDKFIETLLGKKEDRFSNLSTTIPLATKPQREFKSQLYWFREYLIGLNSVFDDAHSDLLNIRDEILGDLNQFFYLMTLHK